MEKKFSKRSMDVVENYTGEDFVDIKDANRNGGTDNHKENIHFNEKAKYNGICSRGAGDVEAVYKIIEYLISDNRAKEIPLDFQFSSFSRGPETISYFSEKPFSILAEFKDAYAVDIEEYSLNKTEKEVLCSGLNDFFIDKVVDENEKEISVDFLKEILSKIKGGRDEKGFKQAESELKKNGKKIKIIGRMYPNQKKFQEHQKLYDQMKEKLKKNVPWKYKDLYGEKSMES